MEETTLLLRIDWSELDAFGHVNNVMFYKYLQAARVMFWEQIGLYDQYKNDGIAPLLASATVDFKKTLMYPGNVTIQYTVAFIKNTSFGLEYILYNDNDEIVALGKDAMVLYDFNKNEKLSIPDVLRLSIEKYQFE